MYILLIFFLFVKVSYFCELQQTLHVFKPYSTFWGFQPALVCWLAAPASRPSAVIKQQINCAHFLSSIGKERACKA